MIDYCIEMKDVCFGYQKQLLFEDLNLNFQPAQSVGIIGANGAGKSTLLKLLIGLLPANSGTITINGLKLDNDNLKAIRSQISYLFQDSESQLFCSNVYDEIAFGPRNYGHSEEKTRNLVEQALKAIHIEHLRDKSTYQLSGGEKKLVSLATVLSLQPDILLLDEPTGTLDPLNRANIIRILNELPTTKIITTHDLDFVLDCCQRVIVINHGRVVADGDPEILLKDEKLLKENGLLLPLSLSKR